MKRRFSKNSFRRGSQLKPNSCMESILHAEFVLAVFFASNYLNYEYEKLNQSLIEVKTKTNHTKISEA